MAEERRPGARSNQSRIPESLQNISTSPDGTPSTQAEGQEGRRRKRNEKAFKVEQEVYLAVSSGSCRPPRLSAGKPRVRALGDEFPQVMVDWFRKRRMQANKAQVACFCELKSSNVRKIVGREDRTIGSE